MSKNKVLLEDQAKFNKILLEAAKLRWGKLNDYGASYKTFGPLGVAVRMGDKMARIARLIQGNTPKYESLRDSAIDLLNYSAMLILLLDEKSKK